MFRARSIARCRRTAPKAVRWSHAGCAWPTNSRSEIRKLARAFGGCTTTRAIGRRMRRPPGSKLPGPNRSTCPFFVRRFRPACGTDDHGGPLHSVERLRGQELTMTPAQQYDTLSTDYHWLYSDYVLSGKMALDDNGDVLALADLKASILDCSCGIGTFAIALAKLGYEVSGSDGSQGMVDQAILAARQADIDLPLKCCTWEDLPVHVAGPFDLVFCLGNAIGHTRNGEEMLRSLQGMRAVLRSGGKLVIDSR